MIEFKSVVFKFDGNLWGYHFMVPDDIAKAFITKENKRVICLIEDKIRIHSALMSSKLGWFILLNKKQITTLNLSVNDSIAIGIEKDNSEFGIPMPEELSVMLDQDEEGNRLFMALTKGKQRSLIYIVSKVKNTNSRINKALAILDHLKSQNGNLDFKKLNETIKYYNQRKHLL